MAQPISMWSKNQSVGLNCENHFTWSSYGMLKALYLDVVLGGHLLPVFTLGVGVALYLHNLLRHAVVVLAMASDKVERALVS